jgi:geranylgeranyl pyrophosphate synthase
LRRALHPGQGDPISLIIDGSKKATRGQVMDAVAKMKDPTTETYLRMRTPE